MRSVRRTNTDYGGTRVGHGLDSSMHWIGLDWVKMGGMTDPFLINSIQGGPKK